MNIYPRDLLSNSKTGLIKQAFVMMPFSSELDKTFVTISDACKELGITCLRADSLYNPKPILTSIVESIGTSQVLIVDMTDKNPNVFYELGIAHTNRRLESVILISQTLEDVPFDLRHLPILVYSMDSQLKLKVELKSRITVSIATTNSLNVIRQLMFGGNFNNHQVNSFIDTLSSSLPSLVQQVARFLEDMPNDTDNFENAYWTIVKSIDEFSDLTQQQLQFLAISLLSCEYAIREQNGFIQEQLRPVLTSRYGDEKLRHPMIISSLCFAAIRNGFLKSESINWLISYLQNEKMGRIDPLRGQIEAWLIEDRDDDIEKALVQELKSDLPHMREAVADILGMRRSPNSIARVADALDIEGDPYAARSMISAISRGNNSNHVKRIENWIIQNSHLWTSGPKSPSLPNTAIQALRHMGCNAEAISIFEQRVSKLR
ncbi:HEAT repeat domain-containing protein [Magnetovibrio sp. PR-2]|uniref:HEAT repeat domain-containing protein n=1 Tax=Magnetovibrio sp. PR-2 TaxID=3120356 RepID=UPI002FCE02D5